MSAARLADKLDTAQDEAPCELTILMPCLNEAETLGLCLTEAQSFLARSGIVGEIVVADNGSSDGSQAIARAHGARVVEVQKRGYGAALLGGIAAARGRYVVMGDSDASYDFSRLEPFVAKLREGCDLVMGNRFLGGIEPGAMPRLHRYLGNPLLTGLGRLLYGSPIADFHCGLRAFRTDAIRALGLRAHGMEFASEMVVKATLKGLRLAEVPTVLAPDKRGRAPHLRPWRDGWRHVRLLLLHAPRWLFLYPGLALMLVGLAAMAAVLPGPLRIGSVVFDVHTLIVAMGAVIVGSQTVLFFLLAERFAVAADLVPARPPRWLALRQLGLGHAVLTGSLLLAAGLAGLVLAVALWGAASFQDLDYSWMMRLVIPAVTLIAFGMQVILSGFLASLIDLKLAGRSRSETG